MGSKHEGQIDQWQGGSVTPREHNLRRAAGTPSRREQRLEEPPEAEEHRGGEPRDGDDGTRVEG